MAGAFYHQGMPTAAGPLLPMALRSGDRVAVIAPASPLREKAALEDGLARLRRWGLKPEAGKHAHESFGFLAGQDAARAEDLQAAISDPKVRAIFCARGGYGLTRILDRIDFAPLAKDPKPIVGFSDVTALLAAASNATGLCGFHGPMVAGADFDAATEELQRALLFEPRAAGVLPPDAAGPPPHVMVPGIAEGPLAGGNLSLVAALQATSFAPKTPGAIVFLEDTDEAPYRIDRMLTQLFAAGFFERIAGVVLGDFAGATPPPGSEATDLAWVLHDRLGRLKVPVAFGFPFGHRPRSWTLPVGVRARLDAPDRAKTPTLAVMDPAVRRA
jgi:muramoyltetrapeptide carboxypeptidase